MDIFEFGDEDEELPAPSYRRSRPLNFNNSTWQATSVYSSSSESDEESEVPHSTPFRLQINGNVNIQGKKTTPKMFPKGVGLLDYLILKFFAIVFIECTTFNNFSLLMVILEKNMFMNEDFFDYSNISGIHGEYL